MKLNKKGFTLIELLAVIVILAIIMVIAVPQILNVIENSRVSAWDNNVKLIEEALDLNTTLASTPMAEFSLSTSCVSESASSKTDITTAISNIAKISAADTKVECYKDGTAYKISVSPVSGGQFGNVPATKDSKTLWPVELTY